MRTIPRRGSDERGSVLLFAVFMVTGLVGLSVAFLRVTSQQSARLGSRVDDERAYQLAEAGITEAIQALDGGGDGNIGSQAAPATLGDGLLWVTANDPGNGTRELVVRAMSGSGRSSLRAIVEAPGGDEPLFKATLNSDEELTLNEGVVIDSFDSKVGTYASQQVNLTNGHPHAGMNGHVMSNQDITLNANATTFGNATPGPGHAVNFNNGSYVSGSTAPSPEKFTFPPVQVPTTLPPASSVSVGTNGYTKMAPGKYDMASMSIGKSGTLLIEGPATIAVGDFVGGKDANLEIDATNGPVTIFCTGSYTHTSGFAADAVTDSPMALAFFITAPQDIVFPMGSQVRGAYYAPEATIQFANDSEAWGAFAAKRIEMANTMNFHFDESLMDYWEEDIGQAYEGALVLSWVETEFEPAALMRDRRDPFLLLGVDKAALPTPWELWTSQL